MKMLTKKELERLNTLLNRAINNEQLVLLLAEEDDETSHYGFTLSNKGLIEDEMPSYSDTWDQVDGADVDAVNIQLSLKDTKQVREIALKDQKQEEPKDIRVAKALSGFDNMTDLALAYLEAESLR